MYKSGPKVGRPSNTALAAEHAPFVSVSRRTDVPACCVCMRILFSEARRDCPPEKEQPPQVCMRVPSSWLISIGNEFWSTGRADTLNPQHAFHKIMQGHKQTHSYIYIYTHAPCVAPCSRQGIKLRSRVLVNDVYFGVYSVAHYNIARHCYAVCYYFACSASAAVRSVSSLPLACAP